MGEFKARLDAAQAETISRAVAALSAASTVAVATLHALLTDGPPAVRLGAARAILEIGARLREGHELEQRLSELEAAVTAAGGIKQ